MSKPTQDTQDNLNQTNPITVSQFHLSTYIRTLYKVRTQYSQQCHRRWRKGNKTPTPHIHTPYLVETYPNQIQKASVYKTPKPPQSQPQSQYPVPFRGTPSFKSQKIYLQCNSNPRYTMQYENKQTNKQTNIATITNNR